VKSSGLEDDVFAEVADAEPIFLEHSADECVRGANLQLRFGFMLPLRSSSRIPVIGWMSFEKTVRSCLTPLSSTSKQRASGRARAGLRVRDRRVDGDRARRGAEGRRLLLRVRGDECSRGHQPVIRSRIRIGNAPEDTYI